MINRELREDTRWSVFFFRFDVERLPRFGGWRVALTTLLFAVSLCENFWTFNRDQLITALDFEWKPNLNMKEGAFFFEHRHHFEFAARSPQCLA